MASPADIPPPRNPDDLGLGPVVMGITWTFTALASISTALRLYTRKRIAPHLAIEDWLMAIAMVRLGLILFVFCLECLDDLPNSRY